jgi:hypothetical protein
MLYITRKFVTLLGHLLLSKKVEKHCSEDYISKSTQFIFGLEHKIVCDAFIVLISWPFIPVMFCWMRNVHVKAVHTLYIITDDAIYFEIENHEPPCCACFISEKSANKKISMEK